MRQLAFPGFAPYLGSASHVASLRQIPPISSAAAGDALEALTGGVPGLLEIKCPFKFSGQGKEPLKAGWDRAEDFANYICQVQAQLEVSKPALVWNLSNPRGFGFGTPPKKTWGSVDCFLSDGIGGWVPLAGPPARTPKERSGRQRDHRVCCASVQVMDREWAHLYCWTERNGSTLFHIRRDRAFWQLMYGMVRDLWFGHLVPARFASRLGCPQEASTRTFSTVSRDRTGDGRPFPFFHAPQHLRFFQPEPNHDRFQELKQWATRYERALTLPLLTPALEPLCRRDLQDRGRRPELPVPGRDRRSRPDTDPGGHGGRTPGLRAGGRLAVAACAVVTDSPGGRFRILSAANRKFDP